MKRHREAIESYDKALVLRPDFVEALHNRGFSLYGLGHYRDALAYYDQALSINANYPDAFKQRGRALQALGHRAEAMESYDKAIALQPDHADAFLNKSLLLLLLGELEAGWALYEWRWKASDAPAQREVRKPSGSERCPSRVSDCCFTRSKGSATRSSFAGTQKSCRPLGRTSFSRCRGSSGGCCKTSRARAKSWLQGMSRCNTICIARC
jgi:Tfp pilus assembly protein PilF